MLDASSDTVIINEEVVAKTITIDPVTPDTNQRAQGDTPGDNILLTKEGRGEQVKSSEWEGEDGKTAW